MANEEEEENKGEKEEDNLMDVEEEEERNQAERADCKGVDKQNVQVEKEDDKTDESEAPQIFPNGHFGWWLDVFL